MNEQKVKKYLVLYYFTLSGCSKKGEMEMTWNEVGKIVNIT